jgi:ATP-dependent RNA helicase DDX24/MAK5
MPGVLMEDTTAIEKGKRKRKQEKLLPRKSRVIAGGRPVVKSDALSWKTVTLPDRLDDAEGFYLLEEIDDVEVVRDESNGVMFRSLTSGLEVGPEEAENDEVIGEEDEWEGFSDEADSGVTSAPDAAPPPRLNGILKHKHDHPSSGIDSDQGESDEDLEDGNVFDLLNEVPQDTGDASAWEELELSEPIIKALTNIGFTKPTPIQAAAIPPILKGKDVIGKAITGSGKTLAFGIPIIEHWLSVTAESRVPVALILAPTRELAHQLHDHVSTLAEGLDRQPRVVKVTGGLSILKQQRQLEHADIIIATPGRLWEVINESQGLIEQLKQVRYLVIDEADRLLSEGHFKEVEDIIDTIDRQVLDESNRPVSSRPQRQILVFSATFNRGLHQKLAGKLKNGTTSDLLSNQQSLAYLLKKLPFPKHTKPMFIDPSPESTMASQLTESILQCPANDKDLYLYALLLLNHNLKTLIFANSINTVKRVHTFLSTLSLPSEVLHGDKMPQKSRLRALERFHDIPNSILVATDVAARGLDIKGIQLIVHYHVPRSADMYVHRSGRTARAGAAGKSVLLCSPEEVVPISRLIGKVHEQKEKLNSDTPTGRAPETIYVDSRITTRIRPRVDLAQKITTAAQSQAKTSSSDSWVRKCAEELGQEYDSEEFEEEARRMKRGKGGGREKKRREAATTSKGQIGAWKAKLGELLRKKVNLGVSERYLAGGGVNVDQLLDGTGEAASGVFLEGTR